MLYIVDIHGEIEGDYSIIGKYTPETVTEFADKCQECGKANKKRVYRNCRNAFVEAVEKVFTDTDAFLGIIRRYDR